jgi:HSP20 family protein
MALRPPRSGFSVARRMSERARAARAESAAPDPDLLGGGFAGMVEALRGLVTQLAAAAQHGTGASADAGASTVDFAGGKGRMVFGYTLRMGQDGVSAEPFGDLPAEKATAPAPARQPIVDVFEDGGFVVVVAELPGADPASIVCRAAPRSLTIEAGGARRYRKELALPAEVRPAGLKHSFQNGILEVRLERVAGV